MGSTFFFFLDPVLHFFFFFRFCWESISRRTRGRSAHLGPDQANKGGTWRKGGKKGRNITWATRIGFFNKEGGLHRFSHDSQDVAVMAYLFSPGIMTPISGIFQNRTNVNSRNVLMQCPQSPNHLDIVLPNISAQCLIGVSIVVLMEYWVSEHFWHASSCKEIKA